ncbi:MAG: extracellular solute-binding protein [Anaerolineae bacterium]|nr:extracellular solute-binding protein [Anaerolineae bacterium]
MQTPRINWALFITYTIASLAILIAALVSPAVRTAAPAPLRDVILPPPKPVTITLLYSTEKEEWLKEVIPLFESSRIRVNGKPIKIETDLMGSREMVLAVMDGEQKPVVLSPASSLQVSILEDQSAARYGRPYVVTNDNSVCRSVLKTPLVLVAWEERARVLWGNEPPGDLWRQLHDDLVNPQGWQAFNHPEWGYIKFGHTNPLGSNSGLMTILLMSYDFFNKTSGLESGDILSNMSYQRWFIDLETSIPAFGDSTGTYMKDIIAYGPSVYDIVAVYESVAIENAENAVGKYGALRVYYPPATIVSDHPFCIMDAEWVDDEQRQAAAKFIDFILQPEAQQLALDKYGYRPAEASIPLDGAGSPFLRYQDNGLRITLPPEIDLPDGSTLNTLLDFWARNIDR